MTKEQMKSEIREMEKWLYPCRIYFGEHVKEEDAMGYFQDEQDGLWKGYEYMAVSYTHLDVYKRQAR